jgi:hypothetical protein
MGVLPMFHISWTDSVLSQNEVILINHKINSLHFSYN